MPDQLNTGPRNKQSYRMGRISNDQRLSEWLSPVWSGRCEEGTCPPGMGTSAMRTQRRHPTGSSRIMGLVFHRIERNHLHHCLRKATIPTGVSRRTQFPALPFIGEEIPHPWRISPTATAGRRLSVQRGSLVKAASSHCGGGEVVLSGVLLERRQEHDGTRSAPWHVRVQRSIAFPRCFR